MNKIRFIFNYIYFYFTSGNRHSIHSPFVYDVYDSIIKSKSIYYIFKEIESRRKELHSSNQEIEVKDLGAGSSISATRSTIRKVSKIARHAEKSTILAQVLFSFVEVFKPKTIFDLGTSLGLTTLYLASPDKKNKIYTFEGCPATMGIAKEGFKQFAFNNIIPVIGNIDQTLPETIKEVEKVDLVFFDANHRYEPTISYFNTCLSKANEESIFIFDDIYWSEEMEKAWTEIKLHPSVTLTIDLFFIGIVFFRTNQPKQHFKLKL